MSDFATINPSDGFDPRFDWAMDGPDLETDDGLRTAVTLSLFSDRRATDDDILPNADDTDRRGWWGDLPVDTQAQSDRPGPDLLGSRLWLLERAKATTQTAAKAKQYCVEALSWLIEDGVAHSVDVTTEWESNEFLGIGIAISRFAEDGSLVDHRFDFVWNATLAGHTPAAPGSIVIDLNLIDLDFSREQNFALGNIAGAI